MKSVTKSAECKRTTPIDTLANFGTLIADFITNNPRGCTAYESGGQNIATIVRGTEYYSREVVYENTLAKTVGQINIKAPTTSAYH